MILQRRAPIISRRWCCSQGLELPSEADSLRWKKLGLRSVSFVSLLRFSVVFLKIHVFRHHPNAREYVWIIRSSMIPNDPPNFNRTAKNTLSIQSFVDWMIEISGGFIFFIFTPKFGEDSHCDWYFSKGLVQPPTSWWFHMFHGQPCDWKTFRSFSRHFWA